MHLKDSYQPDIEAAVRSLAEKGASAVLVTCDPGLSVDIPVFVVPLNVMTEISQNASRYSNLSFRLDASVSESNEHISVASEISMRNSVASTHVEVQVSTELNCIIYVSL